jgi:tetratricopeptide (TPR) repeat protein
MSNATTAEELEISKEGILAHLEALLADRRFASAGRNAGFLRYVVERTLEGKADEIKETVIAIEVYGRASNYDPKTDSIVRVEASRLRQKLRSYYDNEGKSTEIRIHLPSGTYVPQFQCVASARAPEPPVLSGDRSEAVVNPQVEPQSSEPSQTAAARQRAAWAVVAAVLVVLLSLQIAKASKAVDSRDPDALAAWQEGVALLQQDPHVGQSESGAPQTLLRAIERLEFSVARDPKLAPAWATLAEAYDYAYPFVGRDSAEDARRAEAAARRAIELDDKLAAGHHMLGLVLWMFKWDFQQAEASYNRALQLDPNNVYAAVEYADLLRETGRVEQAAQEMRRWRALLPALPQLASKDAEIQLDLGRPDAAIAAAHSALKLRRDYLRAHLALGGAFEMKGDTGAALARYEYVLAVDPLDRRALPAYGYLLARMGQPERAREVIQRLERTNSTLRNCAFQIAVVYAGLGEHDRALDWLERAWRTHQVHFPFAAVESRFRELHKYPRFQQLLDKVKLKPARVTPVT